MIQIDNREAAAHPVTVSCLRRCEGVDVEIVPLQFGDYAFTGGEEHPTLGHIPTIGVEVCTPSDLVEKINTGRFGYQMTGLIDMYDVRVLMVNGAIRPDTDGNIMLPGSPAKVKWDRIMSALFAAQSHGIIFMMARSKDQDIVAGSIYNMWRYWQSPYEEHKSFRRYSVIREAAMPLGIPLDPRVQLLMGLPGIGEDRASAAITDLKSIFSIFTASEERLRQIPGWGHKSAKAVHDFIWRGIIG